MTLGARGGRRASTNQGGSMEACKLGRLYCAAARTSYLHECALLRSAGCLIAQSDVFVCNLNLSCVHAAAVCLIPCHPLQEGEPQGRHVVIVDDLVQSGGTLIECHALLSSLGAAHGEPAAVQSCSTLLQGIWAASQSMHCGRRSLPFAGAWMNAQPLPVTPNQSITWCLA